MSSVFTLYNISTVSLVLTFQHVLVVPKQLLPKHDKTLVRVGFAGADPGFCERRFEFVGLFV